jgi:hypothetical protein
MGEGRGGGGQDENLLDYPFLYPLPPRVGKIFGRMCVINDEVISKNQELPIDP